MKSKCKTTYNHEQVSNLRAHSKELSIAKHKIKKAENYNKTERAKRYQEKRDEISSFAALGRYLLESLV